MLLNGFHEAGDQKPEINTNDGGYTKYEHGFRWDSMKQQSWASQKLDQAWLVAKWLPEITGVAGAWWLVCSEKVGASEQRTDSS